MKSTFLSIYLLLAILFISCGEDSAQKSNVFFKNLKNADVVPSEFVVKMGVEGMKVVPAGEIIEGTGHHHIIVDGQPIPKDEVVPANETHIHYGKGQTETTLNLSEGKHTLTLQFANGVHISYGKEMSKTINIEVKNQ